LPVCGLAGSGLAGSLVGGGLVSGRVGGLLGRRTSRNSAQKGDAGHGRLRPLRRGDAPEAHLQGQTRQGVHQGGRGMGRRALLQAQPRIKGDAVHLANAAQQPYEVLR
jgi:hypothetical protein